VWIWEFRKRVFPAHSSGSTFSTLQHFSGTPAWLATSDALEQLSFRSALDY
jgi:hypothetical protein